MVNSINIFQLHKNIMDEYIGYVKNFINIADKTIYKKINEQLNNGRFWPEPLIQFNPAYKKGVSAEKLAQEKVLHPEMVNVFKKFELYKHQEEALRIGTQNKGFIVTSGTGSGKSLTFLGTIFNFVLYNPGDSIGIIAVIVYPMNALINSQYEKMQEYKKDYEDDTGKVFPVNFAKYTGQENEEEREKIKKTLPHIILTNYMMLELILTRQSDARLKDSIYKSLRFLVYDELHTYRGRQGADIALLNRRIKAECQKEVICIGTSATMVSGVSIKEDKAITAKVAGTLLGTVFESSQVIGEYLTPSLCPDFYLPDREAVKAAVKKNINPDASEEELIKNPLSIWFENGIALDFKEKILIRNKPLTFTQILEKLSDYTNLDFTVCISAITGLFSWVDTINEKIQTENKLRQIKKQIYLPYKLHQFISQTDTVYLTLHYNEGRVITLDPALETTINGNTYPLYPVVFSRISGSHFICVTKDYSTQRLKSRGFRDFISTDTEPDNKSILCHGYLIPRQDVWKPEDVEHFPYAWLKKDSKGELKIVAGLPVVISKYLPYMPESISYDEYGNFTEGEGLKYKGWFMPAKLLFDPTAGVFYDLRTNENTKLSKLGSEGRSTSTTMLSLSVLRILFKNGFSKQDRKLLSFTDNRQDAALQAGHFNDFVQTITIRSAIYTGLVKNKQLDYTNIDEAVFDALNLKQEEYAQKPANFPAKIEDNKNALKLYLKYLCLFDLRRSWKVILPNLEQCALLSITYKNLKENCEYEEQWSESGIELLEKINMEVRKELVFQTLDYFRKAYALYSEPVLSKGAISKNEKIIQEHLLDSWRFDENEKIQEPCFMGCEPVKGRKDFYFTSIGYLSSFGKYIIRLFHSHNLDINKELYNIFMKEYLALLTHAGWIHITHYNNKLLYQLCLDQIIWEPGDKIHVPVDPVKNLTYKNIQLKPNNYFQQLYMTNIEEYISFDAADHTGQIANEDRKERENKFREGIISALYCSPTMELGIDIADLSIVHMRNVPPNPAHYTQRSGRAGRVGKPALVFTNCSNISPHDRHYFENPQNMVAGKVSEPQIDLNNQDLLENHLHSVFLSKHGIEAITPSMLSIVEKDADVVLPIKTIVKKCLTLNETDKRLIKNTFYTITKDINLEWINDDWIDKALAVLPQEFDAIIDRWRMLYREAIQQLKEARAIIDDGNHKINTKPWKEAKRNEYQASYKIKLLENNISGQSYSEFYTFRYLAAEGFLPGYNFTRLPLRVYIPTGDSGEYISRPRFIALREFGPGNIIYHKGLKYQINQILISELEKKLTEARVCRNSGYFMTGEDMKSEVCPVTLEPLDQAEKIITFVNLLEMNETMAKRTTRISCEEEDRLKQGYDIATFFRYKGSKEALINAELKIDGETLLNIRYFPSAEIVMVNKKWRNKGEDGFIVGVISGFWKSKYALKDSKEKKEETKIVKLFTTDTAHSLYLEPVKALNLPQPEARITLLYALKRAIETYFHTESSEIGATLMGDENNPNIFFYESAEGSLGILKQIAENQHIFSDIVEEAIELCRYKDSSYKDKASYDDLLSYYNQRYHDSINRFLIQEALEKLKIASLELKTNPGFNDYDAYYSYILTRIDPASETEKKFINYLYSQNLRLPEDAQKSVPGVYCTADFFYKPDLFIFCDGTPHDRAEVMEKDTNQRKAIRRAGFRYIVYHYNDSIEKFVKEHADIFKKVR